MFFHRSDIDLGGVGYMSITAVVVGRSEQGIIYKVNEETGEIKRGSFIKVIHEEMQYMNTGKFLKFMKCDFRGYASLSATGLKIVLAIIEQVIDEGKNTKEIYLTYSHVRDVFKGWGLELGSSAYYRSINDLIGIGLITKGGAYSFSVNPDMLFNGSGTKQYEASLPTVKPTVIK